MNRRQFLRTLPVVGLGANGMAEAEAVPLPKEVCAHDLLLFGFALKRLLRQEGQGFLVAVSHTRRFFERPTA